METLGLYAREIGIAATTLVVVWLLLKTDQLRPVILFFGAIAIWVAATTSGPTQAFDSLKENARAVVFGARDESVLR